MFLRVLALDYDGTIARDGVLDPDVARAIARARGAGILVVLTTGRIERRLQEVAGDLRFVDAVVAENGACFVVPSTGFRRVLAPPAARELVSALRLEGIRHDVGQSLVDVSADDAQAVLSIVRELELPLVLVFNRGRLMILPQEVSKATGFRQVLTAFRLSRHNAVAVGDAENDHALLETCAVGAAVAWGSQALQRAADLVVPGDGPSAVAPFIDRLVADMQSPGLVAVPGPPWGGRRRLELGVDESGATLWLAVRGRNMLIAGEPRSGKSWVAGLAAEQLILQGYSICAIDPEGDYTSLEPLPGVSIVGGADPLPRPRQLVRVLRHPDQSLVIDLSRRSHAEKAEFVAELLPMLRALRRRAGVPHRILLDEAHYFLPPEEAGAVAADPQGGYVLVTYRASALSPEAIQSSEVLISTRERSAGEVQAISRCGAHPPEAWERCAEILGELTIGQAAVLPCTLESRGELRRIQLIQRLTPHVRHREKYVDLPIAEPKAFVFTSHGRVLSRARSLQEFLEQLAALPAGAVLAHARRADFSRWIGDVYGDYPLAVQLKTVENAIADGADEIRRRIDADVRVRYELEAG